MIFIFSVDVYSFLQTPLQSPSTNVASILKNRNSSNETLLSQADTAKVLCTLSHQAENLFADAADRLCLPALLQFTKNLCRASRDQLYRSNGSKKVNRMWWPTRAWKQKNDSMPLALLLHRVGDVTLRVFRSSRPLLHILKVWAITGPHLMDVSSLKLFYVFFFITKFNRVFFVLFYKYLPCTFVTTICISYFTGCMS